MTTWYQILSGACYVVSAACAASAVFLVEEGYSPAGAAVRGAAFLGLGYAIRAYRPPR